MKPKNLKYPFSWEERRILVQDRVWYVPEHYNDHTAFQFPGWNHPDIFGNDQPICVEYCSGNGTWIAEKAAANPKSNWVAVEKRFERVRKIWSKVKNLRLNNLFVISAEGHSVTSHYFPEASVHEIYINFPDPWPKKRHAKHRIIKLPFVEELYRILKVEGAVTVVTDDVNYSSEVIDVFSKLDGLKSLHQEPFYRTDLEDYGTSYFDRLWRGKGKEIRYHQYQKQVPAG